MYLKSLSIKNDDVVIREIFFHQGLNLIVDETEKEKLQDSGNNVGKTTVLKLIDFCFGSAGRNIYQDTEFREKKNSQIERFLKGNNIIISLVLTNDLATKEEDDICIRRNFLTGKEKILEINGTSYNNQDFKNKLQSLIFKTKVEKPTFRQMIAKNIRYEKNSLENALKVLHTTTTFEEYEALFLFWLGINTDTLSKKQKLRIEMNTEDNIYKRLNKEKTISQIKQALSVYKNEIAELMAKRNNFQFNEDYETQLKELNSIKSRMNTNATKVGSLNLRKEIILEAKNDLQKEIVDIDTNVLEEIYKTAEKFNQNLHIKFSELLAFHNEMLNEKIRFICAELPEIEKEIDIINRSLANDAKKEKELSSILFKSGAIEELNEIDRNLNDLHEKKGRFEEKERLLTDTEKRLQEIKQQLAEIDQEISLKDSLMENQITEFNRNFTKISEKLYNEKFILSKEKADRGYDLKISSIEGNLGSGKKKGQIVAFDIAYIQFCDDNNIPCLHFVLLDQLELMHDNQLISIADIVECSYLQLIIPVLKDKLPPDMDTEKYQILKLSQENKLFRIKDSDQNILEK
jgi:uncharacterized protein YydD (DUF2326 family)